MLAGLCFGVGTAADFPYAPSMNFLKTERLNLQPLGPQDSELIRAHWEDAALRRWTWGSPPPSAEPVREALVASRSSFQAHGWGLWCIHHQDIVVGVCGLRQVAGQDHPELICSLQPAWWDQGLAHEACIAVLRAGFGKGQERILVGMTAPEQDPGRAFVARLGFDSSIELGDSRGVVAYSALTAHTLEERHPVAWRCKAFGELSVAELYEILALRAQVFVVEQDCAYQDLDGADASAMHLMFWGPGRTLAAYLRSFPPESLREEIVIGRVVTSLSARGQGLGRELMREGMRRAWRQWGDHPIHVSAQAHLQDWYNSLGFVVCGPGYPEDGIPHLPMRCAGKSALD